MNELIIFFFFLHKRGTLLNKGKNTILAHTFWSYNQFSPYILVTVNLVATVNLLTENVYMANNLHCWHIQYLNIK